MAEIISFSDYKKAQADSTPNENLGVCAVNPDEEVMAMLDEEEKIMELGKKLLQFVKDVDTYNFKDEAESEEDALNEILASIRNKELEPIREYITEILGESDDLETIEQANEVLSEMEAWLGK